MKRFNIDSTLKNKTNMDQVKLHSVISLLVHLPGSKEKKSEFLQELKLNTDKAIELLNPCSELKAKITKSAKVTPKFIFTSLYVLKLMAKLSSGDSPASLISIQQQQKIKILLQMVFSLGLTPSLFKGVDIPLKNNTSQLYLSNLEELKLVESYVMMSEIVRTLLKILNVPNLRSLILTHLGDLMAALLQLIHTGEFKKPVKKDSEDKKDVQNNANEFVMTEKWYNRLIKDRNDFKVMYKKLVDDIYKPLVIRELLILLSPSRNIESGEIQTPPSWLRRVVSCQLTGYLMSPGGVSLLMRAMCESSTDTVDWKKVEGVAKLISTVHGNLSNDKFYSVISPQIISLLNTTGTYCIPVAKKCISNIYHSNVNICNKYIFDKLFEPFIICSKSVSENFSGTLISEDSLSRCIEHLSKCFAPGSKESSLPISVLLKIIKILYLLYMKVAKSPYQHKSAIQNLLIEFLYSEKDINKLTLIYNTLIFKERHTDIIEMNPELEFEFGPSGGVQVSKRPKNVPLDFPGSEYELEFEIAGDHMLNLLSHHQDYSKKLLSDLFVILLSALTDFYDNKIDVPNSNPDLLSVEELIVFLVKISQKRVITIKLLADLAENDYVVESIQENPEMVFKFVVSLLESKSKDLLRDSETDSFKVDFDDERDDENEDSNKEDNADIFVILAVVDLMTINVKFNSDRWDMCKSLLKSIETIKDNCQDSFIKYFSDLLYKRIVTRGAVLGSKRPQSRFFSYDKSVNGSDHVERNDNDKKDKTQDSNIKLPRDNKSKKNRKIVVEIEKNEKGSKELNEILHEICVEDIPTRGHAIIQLRKLINRKDSKTLSKKDYIFSVLKCNLKHDDTYIYLATINALEALAYVQGADKILELLCSEYVDSKKDCGELQMKIGEVLMRITRGLGEVVPKHKSLLINTFLFGAKSTDELLRVSSLSNLGELLKILGYGVGSILQEVFICVENIAMRDKSDMARRAAVMVAQLLLKGVTEDSFLMLESVISDLYRTLLHIYNTDKDEVTRLHAELALSEINRLVRSSFCKTLKLEKYIGILDLPQ